MPLIKATFIKRVAVIVGVCVVLALGASIVGVGYYAFGTPPDNRLPLPDSLISLDSPQGQQLLAESRFNQDYQPLAASFEKQKRRAYCGVASAVMVLNALPPATPAQRWDQASFFTPAASEVRSALAVTFAGMTLEEFAKLLRSHQTVADAIPASASNLEQFRQTARDNVARAADFVVVNYQRGTLGQTKVGHISPLAAYHEASDRFLILDVTSYEYPSVWVGAAALWDAMNTQDSSSGMTRGFVTVRR